VASAYVSGYSIDPAWLISGCEAIVSNPRLSIPLASNLQLLEVKASAPLPASPGEIPDRIALPLTPAEFAALRQFFELLDQWDRKDANDSL